ncbi:MAG: thioredoxin-disulfide reductase [Caldiserica bacterium]|jgi:thioredoxin reductase (NADPH)|nr:thioredoxin-disulfide reductase [Caldisericota bacterium]MDH7562741.1 thioredoxin-disulfide reductase [Caldisericota bacterium]
MEKEVLPLIIVGGGPAGLTAGIYSCRFGIKSLLIAPFGGGLAASVDRIENFPGFPEEINGMDLVNRMREQAEKFGLEIVNGQVSQIGVEGGLFRVIGDDHYLSRAIIIATGAEPKQLGVPGEEKFRGKGVSYCATCDGPFFKGKKVTVVGGGDSALQEALYLSQIAQEVILVHRREQFRGSSYLGEKVRANPKITLRLNSVITEIRGEERVREISIKATDTGKVERISSDGVFIYAGIKPNSEIVKELVELDPQGAIITDEQMRTSHEGIFACGDVRASDFRQVVTACADGAVAARSAYLFLNPEK